MKFKDISKEEKLALCEAAIDGKLIEYFDRLRSEWKSKPVKDAFTVEFLDSLEYRIAPEKPSINWGHVAPEFNYMCAASSGVVTLCKEKPFWNGSGWFNGVKYIEAGAYASFKPGNCAPEDSLVERLK